MAGRFEILTVFKSVDKTTAPVTRMQNSVGRFATASKRSIWSVNRSVDKLNGGIKNIGIVAKTSLFGSAGLLGGMTLLLREFAKVETAEAAFTPLLRSAEKAKGLVASIQKTAAETPFGFKDLAKSAKFLLPVMNSDAEKTLATVRMLGDTAGGSAQTLESVTRGFTKAMLKGRTDMESLNIIAEAGVPIFTELAKSMGTKVSPAFFKMVSAGRISTAQLIKAFEDMTSEGGLFYRGMEILSKTLAGRFNALKDNITQLAAKLGGIFAPTVKDVINQFLHLTLLAKRWVIVNEKMINEEFLIFVQDLKKEFGGLDKKLEKLERKDVKAFFTKIKDIIIFLKNNGATILKAVGYFIAFVAVVKVLSGILTIASFFIFIGWWGALAVAIGAAILAVINFRKEIAEAFQVHIIDNFVNGWKTKLAKLKIWIRETFGNLNIAKAFGFGKNDFPERTEDLTEDQRQVQSILSRTQNMLMDRDIERRNNSTTIFVKPEEGTTARSEGSNLQGSLVMLDTGAFA